MLEGAQAHIIFQDHQRGVHPDVTNVVNLDIMHQTVHKEKVKDSSRERDHDMTQDKSRRNMEEKKVYTPPRRPFSPRGKMDYQKGSFLNPKNSLSRADLEKLINSGDIKHRLQYKLCLVCGQPQHTWRKCPKLPSLTPLSSPQRFKRSAWKSVQSQKERTSRSSERSRSHSPVNAKSKRTITKTRSSRTPSPRSSSSSPKVQIRGYDTQDEEDIFEDDIQDIDAFQAYLEMYDHLMLD